MLKLDLENIRLERSESKEIWNLKMLGSWGTLDLTVSGMEGPRSWVRDNLNIMQA